MKLKLLECSILGILAGMARVAGAQQAEAPKDLPPPPEAGDFRCTDQECVSDKGLLFVLRTRAYDKPKSEGTSKRSSSAALQPDRRTTVAYEQPGQAITMGRFSIDLPDGGVVWATEDPNLGQPELAVSAPGFVAFDGTRIVKPVRFAMRSNYPAFIRRLEVTVYRASDSDLVEPIARIPMNVAAVSQSEWDGRLPGEFRAGDVLRYVLRAYGDGGTFDETYAQDIQLVTPEEAARGTQRLRETAEKSLSTALSAEQAESQALIANVFAENSLRRQNIRIYGSRIRIQGRNLPVGRSLSINGAPHPVDMENKFVAEYLEPVGEHTFDISLQGSSGNSTQVQRLNVNVTGRYFFGLGLADVTTMQNDIDGSVEPFAVDSRYVDDDWITDGRLAFYIKAKLAGKYLITAQADTTERDIEHLFDGFGEADPRDIFRELDPDLYYPTYGDDSTTYRDVDTMGKFYVRADWDKNQALWGNYDTGFTGTEYAQYVRSLYGGALHWRSHANTDLGEAKTELRGFGSEAESISAHNEFIGTGGSLYYLRNTNILQGSDAVTVEVRDAGIEGRIRNRIALRRGADYEIDYLQGRIILTRPLAQITRENMPTLTRDAPLDGFEQRVIVDYEWVPTGFDDDNLAAGVRGKQWLGDHIAVGGTYVEEARDGQDYTLTGGDLTLQAGRGTYLRTEYAQTESFGTPVFISDNGGFSFDRSNSLTADQEGTNWSLEGRANFKELGWTGQDWAVGGWWREADEGYSTSLYDSGFPVTAYGAELLGQFTENLGIYTLYDRKELGTNILSQEQGTLIWRVDAANTLSGEVRRIDEDLPFLNQQSVGWLGALKYAHRFGTSLELYGLAQVTIDDDDGRYEDNDAFVAGGQYLFGDQSSISGEFSSGDRGNAATLGGEYRLSPIHSVYGGYTYSTDTTAYDSLFNLDHQNGWTLGQRWHLTNRTNFYSESQFLKEPTQSGLAHSFGMDFYPSRGWNLGVAVQTGELTDLLFSNVDRDAVSVSAGHTSQKTDWQSKVEWRKDSGGQQRTQWVTTNRLMYAVNESWRINARLNYADTESDFDTAASAHLVEGNLGFAWRPWNSTRWALFGRYTYLYDLATLNQEGGARVDQRSQIFSLEGVFKPSPHWEFALKAARREGEVRMGRDQGLWLDSGTNFAAAQIRYELRQQWHAMAEYRWLDVDDGGDKQGTLIGLERDLGDHFRLGVGYNFTRFSDDLTDFDYDHQGWFFNGTSRF